MHQISFHEDGDVCFKIELVQGSVSAAHFSAVYVPEQRLIIEPDLVPNYLLPIHFVAH